MSTQKQATTTVVEGNIGTSHPVAPGSILPGRVSFLGYGFSRGFSSTVRQMPHPSPNIIGHHNYLLMRPKIYTEGADTMIDTLTGDIYLLKS